MYYCIFVYDFNSISALYTNRRAATSYDGIMGDLINIMKRNRINMESENKLYYYSEDAQEVYEKSYSVLELIRRANTKRKLLIPIKFVINCTEEEKDRYFYSLDKIFNLIGRREGNILTSTFYRKIKTDLTFKKIKILNENKKLILFERKNLNENTVFSAGSINFYQNEYYLLLLDIDNSDYFYEEERESFKEFRLIEDFVVIIDDDHSLLSEFIHNFKHLINFYIFGIGKDIFYNSDLNIFMGRTYKIIVNIFYLYKDKFQYIFDEEVCEQLGYEIELNENNCYLLNRDTEGLSFIGFNKKENEINEITLQKRMDIMDENINNILHILRNNTVIENIYQEEKENNVEENIIKEKLDFDDFLDLDTISEESFRENTISEESFENIYEEVKKEIINDNEDEEIYEEIDTDNFIEHKDEKSNIKKSMLNIIDLFKNI